MRPTCETQLVACEDGDSQEATAEVILDGLSPSTDKIMLTEVLSHYGGMQDVALLPSGLSKKAVITFGSKWQAAKALADLNGLIAGIASHQSDTSSAGAFFVTYKSGRRKYTP